MSGSDTLSPAASPARAPQSPFRECDRNISVEGVSRRLLRDGDRLSPQHLQCVHDTIQHLLELSDTDGDDAVLFPPTGMHACSIGSFVELSAEDDARFAPPGRQPSVAEDLPDVVSDAATSRLNTSVDEHVAETASALSFLLTGGWHIPNPGSLLLRASQCRRQVRLLSPSSFRSIYC